MNKQGLDKAYSLHCHIERLEDILKHGEELGPGDFLATHFVRANYRLRCELAAALMDDLREQLRDLRKEFEAL